MSVGAWVSVINKKLEITQWPILLTIINNGNIDNVNGNIVYGYIVSRVAP